MYIFYYLSLPRSDFLFFCFAAYSEAKVFCSQTLQPEREVSAYSVRMIKQMVFLITVPPCRQGGSRVTGRGEEEVKKKKKTLLQIILIIDYSFQ